MAFLITVARTDARSAPVKFKLASPCTHSPYAAKGQQANTSKRRSVHRNKDAIVR